MAKWEMTYTATLQDRIDEQAAEIKRLKAEINDLNAFLDDAQKVQENFEADVKRLEKQLYELGIMYHKVKREHAGCRDWRKWCKKAEAERDEAQNELQAAIKWAGKANGQLAEMRAALETIEQNDWRYDLGGHGIKVPGKWSNIARQALATDAGKDAPFVSAIATNRAYRKKGRDDESDEHNL